MHNHSLYRKYMLRSKAKKCILYIIKNKNSTAENLTAFCAANCQRKIKGAIENVGTA